MTIMLTCTCSMIELVPCLISLIQSQSWIWTWEYEGRGYVFVETQAVNRSGVDVSYKCPQVLSLEEKSCELSPYSPILEGLPSHRFPDHLLLAGSSLGLGPHIRPSPDTPSSLRLYPQPTHTLHVIFRGTRQVPRLRIRHSCGGHTCRTHDE